MLEAISFFEAFQYQFFRNAFCAGILASIAAGIIGTYIVIKKMSMISGSIAHGAFGGLGISHFLGKNPLIGGIIFSLGSAIAIGSLKKKERIDTFLSFLWATGMAIGLVFIFLTPGYSSDLFSYLFGNILLVSNADLNMMIILDLIILITIFLLYNPILAVTFDEEYSMTRNINVKLVNIILYSLIALTVIATIRIIGIVLMIAILTIPQATALMFNNTVKKIMIVSTIITIIAVISGLFFSYHLDFAAGPIIILIISSTYMIGSTIKRIQTG